MPCKSLYGVRYYLVMGRLIFVIEQKGLLNYLGRGGGGALKMWALHCVNPGLHKYTVRPGSIDPMTAVVQRVKAFCVLLSFLFHDTTRLNGTLFLIYFISLFHLTP